MPARVKYGKISRREKTPLHPKAEKILSRRSFAPGQRGTGRRNKLSDYGVELREKQKVKRMYGLSEKQFSNYYKKAIRQRGVTGEALLQMLELRLDNIVLMLGFAAARPQARQFVNHGHVTVNGKKVDIPSYQVKVGDEIGVKASSQKNGFFTTRAAELKAENVPGWLTLDSKAMNGKIAAIPSRAELDPTISEQLIIEFYSR